jgi:hypothetical protein
MAAANQGKGSVCTSSNRLTVRGAIRTMTTDSGTLYGNVTLQGVVQQLVFGVIEVPPDATKTLEVGELRGGATANDLFVNVSGSPETAANVIRWAGTFTPPAGLAPAFTIDPVLRPDAKGNVPYAQTLDGTATDPDAGTTLTYGRSIPGPAWLQVDANGTLSGTPALTDSGTNTWQIWASDGTRFDTASLSIFVAEPPRWNDGDANFAYENAVQNTPYSNTLATNVIYYGSQTLTFAKTAGPAWLTVAANGANTNTLPNTLSLNVGQIKNGAMAADLLRNSATSQTTSGAMSANYVVDWSGTVPSVAPASPTLLLGPAAPGQIVLHWTGAGFALQQNSNLANPSAWVNAPSGTANPATNATGAGSLFYRLKWPQ